MADDSSDDDIPIGLKKKSSSSNKKGDILASLLSDMEKNPELNSKLSPETSRLIGNIRKYDVEREINNASTMAKDYSKDALLLMSKQHPTKFLDLDFKDCEYMNDLTLHPLVANMGTSDIPVEWGTMCWEIRNWRKLLQEAQDQFLSMLSERPSIDEVAKQLGSLQLGSLNVDNTKSVSIQKEEVVEEEAIRIARDANMKAKDIPEQILDYLQSIPEVFDELKWSDVNEQTLCRYFELHEGCGDKHPPDNYLRDFGDSTNDILSWRCFDASLQENYIINGKLNLEDLPSPEEAISQIHAIAVARKNSSNSDSFTCANCGKEGSDVTNTCNKCKSVKYCNAACKKKHRHKHKKACERYVAAARTDEINRSKHEKARERFVPQGDALMVVLPIEQINDPFGQQCDTTGCQLAACCIWSRSRDPSTPWYCCLDCQEKDFKGWPADNKDIPLKVMSRALRNAMIERSSKYPAPNMPNLPTGEEDNEEVQQNNTTPMDKRQAQEGWDLTKIFTIRELLMSKPTMCHRANDGKVNCGLVACSRWESKGQMPWNSCLDCQLKDFLGFPEESYELPIDFMTEEHRGIISNKCSRPNNNKKFPNIPTSRPNSGTSVITPPPPHSCTTNDQSKKASKPAAKLSKSAMESYRKWQAEAEKQGGPNAKIVVSKPEAKRIIIEMLHGEGRPMNINEIFLKLKAVVPSVVLKSCLDDMVDKSSSSSDEYAGTLCLKDVGDVRNNLYYIDHTQFDTGWKCDFCQAVFDTLEEANEHEKICLDRKLPPKKESRVISLFKSMRTNDDELTSPSDEDLFEQPPPSEDCPICFLQLPYLSSGNVYMACCGKVICSGCYFTLSEENPTGSAFLCVYCREPKPETEKDMGERYLDRFDVNDADALCSVGCFHQSGNFGFEQSYTKALALWQEAGELGSVESYCNIADAYDNGRGVERDQEKAWHYYESAAMGGNVPARYNLGVTEGLIGNRDRALKHHMIAVKSGCADSLKKIKHLHWNGHATAEEYDLALRSYQAYVDEIKSEQRDRAAAFSDEYTYYKYSKSEKEVILQMREEIEARRRAAREAREATEAPLEAQSEYLNGLAEAVRLAQAGVFEKVQPAGMVEAAAEATPSQQEVDEETSAEEEEEGVESRDIEIVMSQTNCSRAKAVKTLRAKDNNVVNAMSLSYGLKDDDRDDDREDMEYGVGNV